MKRAKVFSRRAIRVPSVIEPNRTNRQFVTQAAAERVAHVINAGLFGSGNQVAGVKKECALQLTVNRKRVFDVEGGIEFAADRISFGIMRAEVALTETAHSGSATVEEPLVDWQSGRLVRAGMVERMHDPDSCAESERRLLKPALQRGQCLIFNNSRGQRFRTERQKIRDPAGGADELNVAAEGGGSDIERVIDQQTTWRDQRAFAQIERLREPERICEIGRLTQKSLGDRSMRDVDVTGGEDQTCFVLFGDPPAEFDPIADLEF